MECAKRSCGQISLWHLIVIAMAIGRVCGLCPMSAWSSTPGSKSNATEAVVVRGTFRHSIVPKSERRSRQC